MLMLSFDQVNKRFGSHVLLEKASFRISKGQKVGLIGPNGTGKTTLLKMLIDQEQPNEGKVNVPKGVRVGYVSQHAEFDDEDTALDSLLKDYQLIADAMYAQEAKLSQASQDEMDQALQDYEQAREAYENIDGDRFAQKAEAMLDALGLAGKVHQSMKSLSGGEKSVVSLAKALLAQPDLLVLDEPGNHLDYIGVAWLEDFLKRFPGAVFMVSHNRYLLDRVVDRILHLEGGKIDEYEGNYSTYRATRLRQLVTQQAAYVADQKHLAALEAQVKRLQETAALLGDKASGQRYKAMKTRLEREQDQSTDKPILAKAGVQAGFQAKASKANIALEIRGYDKRFDANVLFENATMTINAGERVAIVGTNGSGKTTLLRDVVKLGNWEHDIIRIGPSMTVGYGSQEQEQLNENHTVLEALLSVGGLTRDDAVPLLSKFLFSWDDLQKKVELLSGGERNRLQIAQLIVKKPNFLILDEPTNHLDIQTCEAIEEALEEYQGTLLVVSHDRYFLDKLVDRVLEVKDQNLVSFEGNFSNFWLQRQSKSKRAVGRVSKRRKQRENTYKNEKKAKVVQDLEQRLEKLEAEKVILESKISEAFTQGNHQEGRRLANQLDTLQGQLDDAYRQWETQTE